MLMKYPVDYCYSPNLLYCGLIKGTLGIRLPRVVSHVRVTRSCY